MNIHICVNTEFPVPHSPFRTEQLHERANALRMYGLPAHWSEIANASWTDRLVHRAVVIAIEGKPYRVKEARQRAEQRAKKRNAARRSLAACLIPSHVASTLWVPRVRRGDMTLLKYPTVKLVARRQEKPCHEEVAVQQRADYRGAKGSRCRHEGRGPVPHAGCSRKKVSSPTQRQDVVQQVIEQHDYSERARSLAQIAERSCAGAA